jgi:hypothetical protein
MGLKMMSNEKVINMNVVGNFNPYDLESKIVQNGVQKLQFPPITEGYRSSFRILKVGDVVDSNSCHMRSIRPSHDVGDLWDFLGVTMKVLEVPKSPWI